jgi:bifunctional non-homologous end joining protein LigD
VAAFVRFAYIGGMLWRNSRGRPLNGPAAFIHPCQPTVAKEPPSGSGWAHELKHDGYRLQIHVRDADWSACRKENIVGMSFAETYNEPKRATSFAEEYLINGCMAAKGYTETW